MSFIIKQIIKIIAPINKIKLKFAVFAFLISIISPLKLVSASTVYNLTGIPTDFNDFLTVLFRLFYILIEYLLNPIVKISGWLFNGSLNLITTSNATIINIGWNTSLSIANLFFMVLLLAIAGATILGFENFNYKKALPSFLIIALLINFSLTIGNSIIDTTNVFANFFQSSIRATLTGSTDSSASLGNALKITEPEKIQQKYFLDAIKDANADISNAAPKLITMLLFNILTKLVVTFVNLAGAIFMLYRTFWLWLLLILAPLAWIAYAFPKGSKVNQQWSKWWGEFLRWSFFAPLYLFFTFLGVMIGKNTFTAYNISTSSVDMSMFSFGAIMQMGAVFFIMLAGVILSNKIGGGGSNFVVNYVKKSGKAAGKTFKSFMPSKSYGEQMGEAAARRAGGLLTLGGRVSVPGMIDRTKYEGDRAGQEAARLEEQKKKESLQNARQELKDFRGKGARKTREAKLDQLRTEKSELEASLMNLQLKDPALFTSAEKSAMAFLPGELNRLNQEIKISIEKTRMEELELLKNLRKATGSGKVDPAKELKDLLKKLGGEEGGGEEEKKSPEKSK